MSALRDVMYWIVFAPDSVRSKRTSGHVLDGFDARIESTGLLTVRELDEAETHLVNGTHFLTALSDLAQGLKSGV